MPTNPEAPTPNPCASVLARAYAASSPEERVRLCRDATASASESPVTLFLSGKYAEALRADEEGQHRDPEKNRRQGCRRAIMRLVTGDAAGAERDLSRYASAAAPDEREDLLLEASEIASRIATNHPEWHADAADSPYRAFLDRVAANISKSGKL